MRTLGEHVTLESNVCLITSTDAYSPFKFFSFIAMIFFSHPRIPVPSSVFNIASLQVCSV